MSKHDDQKYTREDWFFDEDDYVPWWRVAMGYVVAFALFGIVLALTVPAAFALTNKTPAPAQDDPNEVRIGIMCGTLKGSGAVVIVDPPQGKVYRFDFTCPTSEAKRGAPA